MKMLERVSPRLEENEKFIRNYCANCADIIIRKMKLGKKEKVDCLLVYLEVTMDNVMLKDSVIGKMINYFWEIEPQEMKQFLENDSLGISDVKEIEDLQEVLSVMLAGNAVFFMDAYEKAIKISGKGYPNLSVSEAENEKVLRGSKEGFSDGLKSNSALIRKRIRDTRMKVEEMEIGVRTHTKIQLLYMEDLIRQEFLDEIKNRIQEYEIDGILDSGMIEQLTEDSWASPFPQFQMTERPDRAAMEILNGRIVLLCENSPMALLLPTTFQSFMHTSEDRYSRFEIVSFLRFLRYLGMIVATILPGLYLAVIRFHTQVLPGNLILSLAEARSGVPFTSMAELIFLELSFELIREAGVRMPGALGNAIGIVGGLIVGQSAVTANLVSPVVVMIVALTALGSLAIPAEEFSSPFRLLKYVFLILGGTLGIYGIALGGYLLLSHLAGLVSFGMPYLMPVVKHGLQEGTRADGILRYPFRKMKKRPVYARKDEEIRLKRRK